MILKNGEDRRSVCNGLQKVRAESSSYKLRSSPRFTPACPVTSSSIRTHMSTIHFHKIVKTLALPNANHLHLNTAATAHLLTERSLPSSSCQVLYLSSPFLPNPNHQLSKTPTIPSHHIRGFQNRLELFPFLYPLTPESVFQAVKTLLLKSSSP